MVGRSIQNSLYLLHEILRILNVMKLVLFTGSLFVEYLGLDIVDVFVCVFTKGTSLQ